MAQRDCDLSKVTNLRAEPKLQWRPPGGVLVLSLHGLSLTTRVWLFSSVSRFCTFLYFLLLLSPYNFQLFRFPRDIKSFLCPTLKILVLPHNRQCTYLKRKWCRFWYWCRMTSSFSPCVYCSINFIPTPKKKKKIPDSAPHMRDFWKNSFSSTKMLIIITSDFKISCVCVSFSQWFSFSGHLGGKKVFLKNYPGFLRNSHGVIHTMGGSY